MSMRPYSSTGSNRASSNRTKSPSKLFIDSHNENNQNVKDPRDALLSPGWKRPENAMVGYAGHAPDSKGDMNILDSPLRKEKIGGYSGFMPQTKNVCGVKIIPFSPPSTNRVEPGSTMAMNKSIGSPQRWDYDSSLFSTRKENKEFRSFGKHLDNEERYDKAVDTLMREKNQTQENLLHMLQAKLSERLMSYAQQTIKTRKLFELYDADNDEMINEQEFRRLLENCNVQFDDVQALALFAYFDRNCSGFIEWKDFSENVKIFNPKGGTAVLPKMITSMK